jgi:hypothetical protein
LAISPLTKYLYKWYLSYSYWRIPGHGRTVRMFKLVNQIAIGNNFGLMEASGKVKDDSLEFWYTVYFTHAVTTSQASQKVQVQDISLFRCEEKERHPQPLWILGLSIVRIVYGAQVKLYYINELKLAYRFKTLGVRKKSTLRKFFRARMALPRWLKAFFSVILISAIYFFK